jgi:hypothetical protein
MATNDYWWPLADVDDQCIASVSCCFFDHHHDPAAVPGTMQLSVELHFISLDLEADWGCIFSLL